MIVQNDEENIEFAMNIETIVKDKRLSYIDAVIYYCDSKGIELEIIPKLIPGALYEKIKREAQDLHLLPKPTTYRLIA